MLKEADRGYRTIEVTPEPSGFGAGVRGRHGPFDKVCDKVCDKVFESLLTSAPTRVSVVGFHGLC